MSMASTKLKPSLIQVMSEIDKCYSDYKELPLNIIFGYYNKTFGSYNIEKEKINNIIDTLKKISKPTEQKLKRRIYGSLEKQIGKSVSYLKKKIKYDVCFNNLVMYVNSVVKIDEEEFPLLEKYTCEYEEENLIFNYNGINITCAKELGEKEIHSVRISFYLDEDSKNVVQKNLLKIISQIIDLL
jgi:hypothetical protein